MTSFNHRFSNQKLEPALWIFSGILLLALLFARAVYPERIVLTVGVVLPLVGVLVSLLVLNRKALQSRSAAYGLNSIITVLLVVSIAGVLGFVTSKYPKKWDLTQNKIHTLSDQSVKLIRGLQKPVKAILFSKLEQREQYRVLLENYKGLSPKFEVEYVDPDRELTRVRQANIKNRESETLLLTVGNREAKIESPNEEKITNQLIKLLKDKTPTLCVIQGHGEKSFNSAEADGYQALKKGLTDQAYEVKEVNLVQENKVPDTCQAIAILGPTKAFFPPEIKILQGYLENGGRAVVALDVNLKGSDYNPELNAILANWYVKPLHFLIVDPVSGRLGMDASVAFIPTFSRESAITKDFHGQNAAFPFARPLEIMAAVPSGLSVQWIAQTTPVSWAVGDLQSLSKGAVSFQAGKDKSGPLNTAVSVEGKLPNSKAVQKTRLVIFGSSSFANNNYSRFVGNFDFFLNSVSWVMEDESLIAIRAKEETPSKVELSEKAGTLIFLLTVVFIPVLIAATGVGIWVYRRKL